MQVCLNGANDSGVPVRPAELAAAAAAAVRAGADDIHLHPKTDAGVDSLASDVVAAALVAVRDAVPGVPVGVTTGAWSEPDPLRRTALVRSWTVLPDHASVNWHEPGAEQVAVALLERGVAVEAGLFSGTDAVARFRAWQGNARAGRVLAEVTDTTAGTAVATARALLRALDGWWSGPILLHGAADGAWPVLWLAREMGLDIRIGLEDVAVLPDGLPTADNSALVRAAVTGG